MCAQARYEPVHGYLSIVVCVLGTLFNLLNILVLTHKDLRSNPINLILTGAAEGITVCESIRRQFKMSATCQAVQCALLACEQI